MIAAAAERTERIRIGTGVISLPYHHPLMVANRIMQLDHMTRGPRDVRSGTGTAAVGRGDAGRAGAEAARSNVRVARRDPATARRRRQ